MSLVVTLQACYLIRPRPELLAHLRAEAPDLTDLFAEPTVWSGTETVGSHPPSSARRQALSEARTKVLFLGNLVREYGRPSWLVTLLGEGDLRLASFDRWWSLEVLLPEESSGDIERAVRRELAGAFARPEDSELAEWMGELVSK